LKEHPPIQLSVHRRNWRRLEDDFRTLIASGFEFPDVVPTLLTEFSDQEGDTGPRPTKRLSPSDSKHPLVPSDASSDRGDGVPASGGAGGTFAGRTYESGSAFAADSTEAEPREVNAVSADGETVGDAIPEVSRVLMARYDRVRIYDLVWAIGGSRAAKTLGIDPHSMSRLCKDIHVPVPTGAYWAKLKAGKPVDAPAPLPPVQIAESGKIVDGLIAPRPIMGKSSGESLQMNDSQSVQHTEAEKIGEEGPSPRLAEDELAEPRCHIPAADHQNDVTGAAKTECDSTADSNQELPQVLASLVSRYDRVHLFEEVWTSPVRTVAKRYNVSDVALLKTCKKLYIPVPPMGYWAKVAANKPVESRPDLPPVQVVQKLPKRHGRMHSDEEIVKILQQINLAAARGIQVKIVCAEAQIGLDTLIRWRKMKRFQGMDPAGSNPGRNTPI